MKRILFLVNHHVVIYNFRRELVERLLHQDYQVYISSPYGKRIDDLIQMGCEYIETDIVRHGKNPINELRLIAEYRSILKTVQPDAMLTYTVKPNIYGNLANKGLDIPSLATITGLGTAVENSGIMKKFLVQLYKVALKDAKCVFFQNVENAQFFTDNKIQLRKRRVIPGSGVNLEQHCFEEYLEEDGATRFLFIGRIMRNKGIEELVEAASVIKEIYPNVIFDIVGFCEDDYLDKTRELQALDLVNFHGVQDDVHEYIRKCHAVVLPSYHEGMANVLLEAASTGRPVLASDIPGCRETFDEGVSGFGFRPRDADSLTRVLKRFIALPHEQKKLMGIAGRLKMESEFDRKIVVSAYLEEIDKIIEGVN